MASIRTVEELAGPGALDELARTSVVMDALATLDDAADGRGDDEVAGLRELVRLHVDTVTAAAEVDAPELVAHQQRWEHTRLRTLGSTTTPQTLRQVVQDSLAAWLAPAARVRLRLLYERADEVEPTLPRLRGGELSGPATRYLAAALAGRQDAAVGVVRRALRAGGPGGSGGTVGDVVATLLQPAQVEVGRLWEAGEIDVSQEHAVTAITQTCLGMLSARLTAPRPTGGRMVAATVGEEGHEVGLRMLVALVQERGWEVEYLGGGVPAGSLVDHVARSGPDVLALSVTLFGHVRGARELVDDLRRREETRHVKVLVGGRAFSLAPDLARQVGADGFASDAVGALELCDQWLGPRSPGPADEQFVEVDLADRYGFEDRHREAALAMLAEESGLSVEDLRRGLSRVRR